MAVDMNRRQFLTWSVLTPAAVLTVSTVTKGAKGGATASVNGSTRTASAGGAAGAARGPASRGRHTFGPSPDGKAFLLDGKPFQIRSGEMNPSRIPVEYWRHRIRMAKAMGLNTIAMYLMWDYLEETPGQFDFHTDRRDFARFIRLCQQEGMWVILRPGPFIDSEWDLGGLPPYLLRYPDIKLRVSSAEDPHYMAAVTRYFTKLGPIVKSLMLSGGGPVLMLQIENEYGSYGNSQAYLKELVDLWTALGIPGPFYTEDGLGQVEANHTNVPGGAIGLSGGNVQAVLEAQQAFPGVPSFGGEVYTGWLTHWGDAQFQGVGTDISSTIQGFMNAGMSFNLYMAHGGTNYAYWAGGNANNDSGNYQAIITSYDYEAPITEQGRPTVQYAEYRDLIAQSLGQPLPELPPQIATMTPAPITPVRYASLWDNLPQPLPAAQTVNLQPMEMYGQGHGFILYRKQLAGYTGGALNIEWVHDYATVFQAGKYAGGLSRQAIPQSVAAALNVTNNNAPLTLLPASTVGAKPLLDVFVEGMGRTCYGQALVDRKGILQSADLQNAGALTGALTGWRTYLLPMDEEYVGRLRHRVSDPSRPGQFFKAQLRLNAVADTYIVMSGWTKGVVWVNGHNLGRYWELGPQHRLYCPAPFLRHGTNEILIFDLHQTEPKPISFADALG